MYIWNIIIFSLFTSVELVGENIDLLKTKENLTKSLNNWIESKHKSSSWSWTYPHTQNLNEDNIDNISDK